MMLQTAADWQLMLIDVLSFFRHSEEELEHQCILFSMRAKTCSLLILFPVFSSFITTVNSNEEN